MWSGFFMWWLNIILSIRSPYATNLFDLCRFRQLWHSCRQLKTDSVIGETQDCKAEINLWKILSFLVSITVC